MTIFKGHTPEFWDERYVQFAPKTRSRVHQAMFQALKPGGVLILEAYRPEQIEYQSQYNSGGPPLISMLYDAQMLRQDFRKAEILNLTETTTQLSEGQYHNGEAAVIRAVLCKKN